MNTRLLCTFSDTESLSKTLEEITRAYTVAFDQIFVLENEDNLGELFCTYNIDLAGRNIQLPRTIALHRKKDHNALYTINALNALIRQLNDGELDETYSVPWQNYENTLLLTSQRELREIPTELFMIHEL